MKKTLYSLVGCLAFLFCFSCTAIDNYDSPDARLSGRIIDQTTGENFLGEAGIRMWEISWDSLPQPRDLAVMQDGTYNNTKLFKGTYDMQAYNGAHWPAERITGIKLANSTVQDFEVIPYIKVVDVKWKLDGLDLTLSCKLEAPITEGLPEVWEIRPFVSLTQFCNTGSRIDEYNKDEYRTNVSKNWADIAASSGSKTSIEFSIPKVLPLKSGRTFYVRLGARVRDIYSKYNYSEIFEVKVP
jgi:hypothetical protein